MSSTASTTDEELDSALDEILGDALGTEEETAVSTTNELESEINDLLNEALSEAENPAVDDEVGGRGHIEGSHPFPKELVEEQVSFIVLCTLKWYYYMSMLFFSLTFICMFVVESNHNILHNRRKKILPIQSFYQHLIHFGNKLVCPKILLMYYHTRVLHTLHPSKPRLFVQY